MSIINNSSRNLVETAERIGYDPKKVTKRLKEGLLDCAYCWDLNSYRALQNLSQGKINLSAPEKQAAYEYLLRRKEERIDEWQDLLGLKEVSISEQLAQELALSWFREGNFSYLNEHLLDLEKLSGTSITLPEKEVRNAAITAIRTGNLTDYTLLKLFFDGEFKIPKTEVQKGIAYCLENGLTKTVLAMKEEFCEEDITLSKEAIQKGFISLAYDIISEPNNPVYRVKALRDFRDAMGIKIPTSTLEKITGHSLRNSEWTYPHALVEIDEKLGDLPEYKKVEIDPTQAQQAYMNCLPKINEHKDDNYSRFLAWRDVLGIEPSEEVYRALFDSLNERTWPSVPDTLDAFRSEGVEG